MPISQAGAGKDSAGVCADRTPVCRRHQIATYVPDSKLKRGGGSTHIIPGSTGKQHAHLLQSVSLLPSQVVIEPLAYAL